MKTKSNTSELKSRPEQLNTGLARINLAQRKANRALNIQTFLGLLRGSSPQFFGMAEVVGRWVWIQFSERQPVEVTSQLAQLGFHWNNVRQAWQHPCGVYRDRRVRFDPRKRYGTCSAVEVLRA